MNELENLVAFLPSMWIFAWFGNPRFAAIGLLRRTSSAASSTRSDTGRKRASGALGYTISMFAFALTWVAALAARAPPLGFA